MNRPINAVSYAQIALKKLLFQTGAANAHVQPELLTAAAVMR